MMKTRSRIAGSKVMQGIWSLLALMACQSGPRSEPLAEPKHVSERAFLPENVRQEDGCKELFDKYCARLRSPENSGNLFIDGPNPIQILQGDTANQLPQVFVKYASAKIRNRSRLPADLQERLGQANYFDKLQVFLRRPPIPKMTLAERLESDRLEAELDSIWDLAIDQTVVLRMSRKFPGYYKIPSKAMPVEYGIEEKRTRRALVSEVSRILWREDANWKKVEAEFEQLRASYLALIDRLDIPESLQSSWREKIQSVKLALPGSFPEIADEECSATKINAYYYRNFNLITICAGNFNSEDIVLTLAHELGHALDVDHDLFQFLVGTQLYRSMIGLRQNVCSAGEKLNCSEWNDFKASLQQRLGEIGTYQAPLPEFNRCLKKTRIDKVMTEADSTRISDSIAMTRISSLASTDVFLRLIEKKVPMRSGRLQSNLNFMNPCAYHLWSRENESVDDEIYTLVFFTAEYQCGDGSKNDRLKLAIETAKRLTAQVIRSVISREGEFSGRSELVSEGFSSSPSERFADVLGAHAVAIYLQKYQELSERRAKYLASASWLCGEPSLETNFPEESMIEESYNMEPHPQPDIRKMEILANPVREALTCKKDFVFDECRLAYRK